MPPKTFILTDVAEDLYVERISLGPEQIGGAARGYSVTKRTLRGGLREGVDVVEVDNGRLRFVVVPTRGMGIWRASCQQVPLGWKSPVHGPVNPAFVPLWEPSGIGWLSGFDELLVRCGLESNGAPEFCTKRRRSATLCTARSPTSPPTRSRSPLTARRARSSSPGWSRKRGSLATSSVWPPPSAPAPVSPG